MSVTVAVHHALREELLDPRHRTMSFNPQLKDFFALGASLNLGAATAYTAWLGISGRPSD
jgi:hypothetical protein